MIDFTQLKKLYAESIDSLLADNGLVVPCTLKYSDISKDTVCPNCVFDPISRLSGHKYNGTGPISFPTGSICPVCKGEGTIQGSGKSEVVNLAVIFDSKYFLNWQGSLTVDVPSGAVQSICKISLVGKIIKADSIIIDNSISSYGSYEYVRDGDPKPCGLGEHKYITTLWSRAP
jgi:rubredoxin